MIHYKFNCPHCGQKLEAAEDMLGTTMDCPSCNGKFTALSIRTANELIFALCRQQHRSSTERRYRDVISKKRMSKDRTYKLRFPAGAGYGKVG